MPTFLGYNVQKTHAVAKVPGLGDPKLTRALNSATSVLREHDEEPVELHVGEGFIAVAGTEHALVLTEEGRASVEEIPASGRKLEKKEARWLNPTFDAVKAAVNVGGSTRNESSLSKEELRGVGEIPAAFADEAEASLAEEADPVGKLKSICKRIYDTVRAGKDASTLLARAKAAHKSGAQVAGKIADRARQDAEDDERPSWDDVWTELEVDMDDPSSGSDDDAEESVNEKAGSYREQLALVIRTAKHSARHRKETMYVFKDRDGNVGLGGETSKANWDKTGKNFGGITREGGQPKKFVATVSQDGTVKMLESVAEAAKTKLKGLPSPQALAAELMSLRGQARQAAKDNGPDDDGNPSAMDIRLQCANGTWALHTGDASFDVSHRGFWGAGSMDGSENAAGCMAIAKDLIRQVEDDYAERADETTTKPANDNNAACKDIAEELMDQVPDSFAQGDDEESEDEGTLDLGALSNALVEADKLGDPEVNALLAEYELHVADGNEEGAKAKLEELAVAAGMDLDEMRRLNKTQRARRDKSRVRNQRSGTHRADLARDRRKVEYRRKLIGGKRYYRLHKKQIARRRAQNSSTDPAERTSPLDEVALTRQHFTAFASAIAGLELPRQVKLEVISGISPYFKAENDGFNEGRFRTAALGKAGEEAEEGDETEESLDETAMLTRQHMEGVAEVVKGLEMQRGYKTQIANAFAGVFEQFNEQFKRDRFLRACGLAATSESTDEAATLTYKATKGISGKEGTEKIRAALTKAGLHVGDGDGDGAHVRFSPSDGEAVLVTVPKDMADGFDDSVKEVFRAYGMTPYGTKESVSSISVYSLRETKENPAAFSELAEKNNWTHVLVAGDSVLGFKTLEEAEIVLDQVSLDADFANAKVLELAKFEERYGLEESSSRSTRGKAGRRPSLRTRVSRPPAPRTGKSMQTCAEGTIRFEDEAEVSYRPSERHDGFPEVFEAKGIETPEQVVNLVRAVAEAAGAEGVCFALDFAPPRCVAQAKAKKVLEAAAPLAPHYVTDVAPELSENWDLTEVAEPAR